MTRHLRLGAGWLARGGERPQPVEVRSGHPNGRIDSGVSPEASSGAGGCRVSRMPDNATVVTNWLRSKPGRYLCQDCISVHTGVAPVNQVNQIVRPLGQTREWRYTKAPCAECGRNRKCITFVGT